MSRSLSSMHPGERAAAIKRRRAKKKGGLGYWAACDAVAKIMAAKKAK